MIPIRSRKGALSAAIGRKYEMSKWEIVFVLIWRYIYLPRWTQPGLDTVTQIYRYTEKVTQQRIFLCSLNACHS